MHFEAAASEQYSREGGRVHGNSEDKQLNSACPTISALIRAITFREPFPVQLSSTGKGVVFSRRPKLQPLPGELEALHPH